MYTKHYIRDCTMYSILILTTLYDMCVFDLKATKYKMEIITKEHF